MDKNQKDMKSDNKTATHSKDEKGKDMMKNQQSTDHKADNKKVDAMKTGDKKMPATAMK